MTVAEQTAPFTEADYPALNTAADEASKAGRKRYTWLKRIDLGLLAAAAVVGGVGSSIPHLGDSAVAAVAAVILMMTLILSFATDQVQFERDWYEGRALSESVKTAVWRYMARVEPYSGEDPAVDKQFVDFLRKAPEIHRDVRQLRDILPMNPTQISHRMREVRALPWEERRHVYAQYRLIDQLSWYRAKARSSARDALRWYWIGIIGRGAALTFAIVRIAAPNLPSLIAVFAALAATAAALNQLGRYEELSKSYALASQDLISLNTLLEIAPNEEEFGRQVLEVESTIFREHASWVTKRP